MSPPTATAGVHERLEVLETVGTGAFGKVFLVLDRGTNQRIALKRLERADPASVYRFKQEFRALADVKHPNLVRLHELFNQDGHWCFSMDFVDGVRFDTWVRGQDRDRRPSSVDSTRSDRSDEPAPSSFDTMPESTRRTVGEVQFHELRLRESLKQLVDGVLALHAAGILHRDLKPSNVLVDKQGRVLILDFGLAATTADGGPSSSDGRFGTPAYMSPEQARGGALTMAADWYAVGVMLYETLTGQLPYGGSASDMLAARLNRDPRDPRSINPNVPSDLADLAMALLNRNSTARPNGFQIAQLVGLDPTAADSPQHVLGGAFVGRSSELKALQDSFEQARAGKTVVAHVHGQSGYGKTTLVRRFLASVSMQREVVVLEGRCYERESMPFKALDDLVDALGRYLTTLPAIEAAALLPRDSRALVRLFPSLGRLDVMTSLPGRAAAKDPQELRRRAFRALRDMFARLTDSRPVVLFIDDVHWGDADSAQLVRNLLAPPEVPPLLLVVGYRDDRVEENELLKTLRTPVAADVSWQTVDIPVGPLSELEAQQLAQSLVSGQAQSERGMRRIADESGGNPLFISELARFAVTHSEHPQAVSLQDVVANRVATLPQPAQLLLRLTACSERPLSEQILSRASDLEVKQLRSHLERLRDERLITMPLKGGSSGSEMLHDKLRQAVRGAMSESQLAKYHAALADALEQTGSSDLQAIAHHHQSAGAPNRARLWWERAADRAEVALAFDRAVRLYQRAIEGGTWDETLKLRRKLAEALVNAGRGPEAAQVFLQLAEHESEPAEALALRQRAAAQYLRAGHVEEALHEYQPLLEQAGLSFPRSPTSALTSLLWNRMKLKLRGLSFMERRESEIPAAELERIDYCWALATGLAGIDLVRSAHYHSVAFSLALQAGEPARIARGLALHAVMKALEHSDSIPIGAEHADNAYALAERIQDSLSMGWAAAAQTIVTFGKFDLPRTIELADEASALLRERSESTFREHGSIEVWFALNALFLSGRLDELAKRAPACAREAEARGDRYTLSTVRAYALTLHWAVQDRPEQGRKEADAAVASWPKDSFYHQHWARLKSVCFLDLYEGEGLRCMERVQKYRPRMKKAMHLRIRVPRTEFNYLEARGALEDWLKTGERKTHRKLIHSKISELEAERWPLAEVYALLLKAGLAAMEDLKRGADAFELAAKTCEKHGLPLHQFASEQRRALCANDAEGARAAQERLASLGVKAPARFIDMLAPTVVTPSS